MRQINPDNINYKFEEVEKIKTDVMMNASDFFFGRKK